MMTISCRRLLSKTKPKKKGDDTLLLLPSSLQQNQKGV
jgi:hypothetical protein